MFKKLYIYMLLVTVTFTISCSYSGAEDPGDTFRVLAASKDWYFVVLGGDVTSDISSGELYGDGGLGRKLIVGYYVESLDYTRAIYANGYHEETRTFFNYFGVELILDENDNQQAVDMELYYNDGEYYYNKADVKFTKENKATNLKGLDDSIANTMSTDQYMDGTGLSVTTTKNSPILYSVATITDSMNRSIVKGYTLVSGKWREEEIDNRSNGASSRKTTGYHSIAPKGDNGTLTYVRDDEKIEVYELNKTNKGRTLTEDTGLGINAVYSTIATNKDQDIFVAYVDKDDQLSMFKKDNDTVDKVASFVDYFNGGKIENVSQPIIKIFDNGTVITSYIDNSSKLLKIIVDDFINSTSLDFITIIPPTDLTVTSFSVDIIEDRLYYIYSTPMGSEISVYENGLWRIIKNYTIYNNLDFVSITGLNKDELYFMFHYKDEYEECNGESSSTHGCADTVLDSADYITVYGFQSYESKISTDLQVGSFATYNGTTYYLYNSSGDFKIAQSCDRYFNPRPPSTSDGLPMVRNGSGIDIFELVNNATGIAESDMIYGTECAR